MAHLINPAGDRIATADAISYDATLRGWVVADVGVFTDPDRLLRIEPTAAEIVAAAERIAKAKRDMVTASVSPAEMASWPIKRGEALAYLSSGIDADAPNLALEAAARGITLAALVGKVIAKASLLAGLEAAIAGRCGAIQDAAAAAGSLAELEAIDPEAGWPV